MYGVLVRRTPLHQTETEMITAWNPFHVINVEAICISKGYQATENVKRIVVYMCNLYPYISIKVVPTKESQLC